jgi:adenosylmethionine-8-amino-7-oxononanoate aminotransferase
VAGFNNVVTLAPPLILSEEDMAFVVRTLKESIESL